MLVAQARPIASPSKVPSNPSNRPLYTLIMSYRTAVEAMQLVLVSGLCAAHSSEQRKEMVAVSKTMNRAVMHALLSFHADFHKRYPDIHMSFFPLYIEYRQP